jgi:glyoxylase-like metal-dependent hydrolase (beta-lactamase superfamily II)
MERVSETEWYEATQMDSGVSLISEPYIKPFYRCNIWHIRGQNKDMLVDSGMGVVSLRQHVSLVSDKPCIAVASHTHFDHIGCHHEFSDRCVHHAESDALANPTKEKLLIDTFVTDQMFTKLPPLPYLSAEYSVKSAPATRLLSHGDVIDLGNRHFEILHTPGHSPGGIMLFEKESGILFSGDTVYDGPLVDDAFHSDIETYISVMEQIKDLPVRVVHGGHFPSFDGKRYKKLIKDYISSKKI